MFLFRAIIRQSSHMEEKQSSKFFGGFLSKSPTSILDKNLFFKPSSPNSIFTDNKIPYESKGIGVALEDEDFDSFSNPKSKMVLFGAKLKKVEVPVDYGMKTKNLQLMDSDGSVNSPCLRELGLSLSEMEMSEEYTCVMTHGNDPKITHIFDDIIVKSCCGGVENLSDLKNENGFTTKGNIVTSLPLVFLQFCYNCKVKLDDDKDIYIYRGEKSFCSPECRFQEMIIEGDEYKL